MNSEHLKDNRRHNIITASRAWGAIYERKKLWRQLTFREPPFEGNEMTAYGSAHEHIALSRFELEQSEICESGNKLVVHDSLPFGASPDAYLRGLPVEIKCPFTQQIYDGIPERYWFQMQLQMCCTKTDACYFFVWTPNETHTELVNYDKDFIEWYTPYALEFMECLQQDKEPKRWSRKPKYIKEK